MLSILEQIGAACPQLAENDPVLLVEDTGSFSILAQVLAARPVVAPSVTSRRPARCHVLDHMRDGEVWDSAQLMAATGYDRSTVNGALRHLVSLSLVRCVGTCGVGTGTFKLYRVTQVGQDEGEDV